jgi:hypothetical protein
MNIKNMTNTAYRLVITVNKNNILTGEQTVNYSLTRVG